MIKQSEAKNIIYSEWKLWCREHSNITEPNGNDAFSFYLSLEQRKSRALAFRNRGDKWQTIHAWLRERRLVKD